MTALSFKERSIGWLSRAMQNRVPYSGTNRFLEGMYAPVQQEHTETRLRVTGELPRELNGLYARIGPNPMQVRNPGAYHWFMGDGMVHGLRLQDGQALWYRNRWVGSDSVRKRQGRELAPGPRRGVADAVNTNVFAHGGRLWAAVEAGAYPVELDGNLDTLRHGLFDSEASRPFTAHPHVDPSTGEAHAVCYDALKPRVLSHVVIDAQCRLSKVVDLPVQHGPMAHDCAITRTQVVVLDLPVTFSLKHVFRGVSLPYGWNDRHEGRVGLLPRDGQAKDVRWFAVDPCYVFHTCNAHDLDDGGVVLDVVVHARMFDRSRIGPETDGHRITFERWHLDPGSDSVRRTVVSDRRQEFPRFNETLALQPYRHAYTAGFDGSASAHALFKHDLHTGQTVTHEHGPGRSTGEAVFVPRQGGRAEDDGWLLSYVYDATTDRSDFVVLHAQALGGAPQAVVHLPTRVPAGFHGNWMPDPV